MNTQNTPDRIEGTFSAFSWYLNNDDGIEVTPEIMDASRDKASSQIAEMVKQGYIEGELILETDDYFFRGWWYPTCHERFHEKPKKEEKTTYRITIIERLSTTVDIPATSLDEALDEARRRYENRDIVLESDDFIDVEFKEA